MPCDDTSRDFFSGEQVWCGREEEEDTRGFVYLYQLSMTWTTVKSVRRVVQVQKRR